MNRKVSVAPMMDCTDRHERFFLRLISKNTFLYTEMVVDEAIKRGDKKISFAPCFSLILISVKLWAEPIMRNFFLN